MSDIRIGLIGGSGLGAAMAEQTRGVIHVIDTPFGPPSAPIIETIWHGLPIYFLARHGEGHTLNPSQVPYRANLFALKKLGVTHVLASGAVGSLREEYKPRDLVIAHQIIDKTRRPATFFDHAAVHVEFAEPFCTVLRKIAIEAGTEINAKKSDLLPETPAPSPASQASSPTVHELGCYVAMEGPAFSTRAESLMHRLWGGDLIGMTAMPEAKLAREAEMAYLLVAMVTDYDSWRQPVVKDEDNKPDPFALLNEIIANLHAATANAVDLIKRIVEIIAADPARAAESPAHQALKLGIWSDKAKLDPAEIQRLSPIWGKYFSPEPAETA